MKKVLLIVAFAIFITFPAFSQEETEEAITITAYYPSPYGVYSDLRLYPQPAKDESLCTPAQEGLMYYNQDESRVEVCRGGVWESLGGGWWTSDDDQNIYNTNEGGNVGVGTTTPQGILDLKTTTSAFLPPRLNTNQRDAINPAIEGMVLYNTEADNLQVYNGNYWTPVNAIKIYTVTDPLIRQRELTSFVPTSPSNSTGYADPNMILRVPVKKGDIVKVTWTGSIAGKIYSYLTPVGPFEGVNPYTTATHLVTNNQGWTADNKVIVVRATADGVITFQESFLALDFGATRSVFVAGRFAVAEVYGSIHTQSSN
jgi:hypothetical protein